MSIYVKVLIGCCVLFLLSVGLCGIALASSTRDGENIGILGLICLILSILGIVGTLLAMLVSAVAKSGTTNVTPGPDITDKKLDE
jgi:ABC-type transport system involved in multi-copper enzyme maturation permease subunit